MNELEKWTEQIEQWIEAQERYTPLKGMANLFRTLATKAQDRSEIIEYGENQARWRKSLRGMNQYTP